MSRIYIFLCMLMLIGCDNYPKDPEDTSQLIRERNTLRIGYVHYAPWTYFEESQPKGLEVEILQGFARESSYRVKWELLSETQGVEKLKKHQIDILAGGFNLESIWKDEVGFTRPYLKLSNQPNEQHVIAVKSGENRFLITLERYLKKNGASILKMYKEVTDEAVSTI